MEDIFCKIINGEIPAVKIWEDEKHLAFLDVNPINSGHALIIPKKHTEYLFDLSNEEYSELMLAVKKIAKILKEKLSPEKIGVIVEGFGVPHIHVHLVPINAGNELDFKRSKPATPEELNKIADKIRE